jgi:hypothetical protein
MLTLVNLYDDVIRVTPVIYSLASHHSCGGQRRSHEVNNSQDILFLLNFTVPLHLYFVLYMKVIGSKLPQTLSVGSKTCAIYIVRNNSLCWTLI